MRRTIPALLTLPLLAGCNSYDWFLLTGYQQEGFSNKADIVFVIDNSFSMTNEAEALAENIASFIDEFAEDEPPATNPSLSDEVGRFLEYVNDRSGNVNYQMGITTTEVSADVGALLGTPNFVRKSDNNVPLKFNRNLLCDAACITRPPPVDITCPEGNPWAAAEANPNCANTLVGSAEEGVEAVYMAMCASVPNPPEACFQDWWLNETTGRYQPNAPAADTGDTDAGDAEPVEYFTQDKVLSNEGWLRENSVVIPVVITDEGDQSRRIPGRDPRPFPYPELFREFGHRLAWAVIGPNPECDFTDSAANWGVQRYQNLVEDSNGAYVPIEVPDGRGGCETADFGDALSEIGDLLRGLADTFPLRAAPVKDTIVVEVNGETVPEVGEDNADGWEYIASENTVVLRGDVVPDFNADVRIWYLPAAGIPRELPF